MDALNANVYGNIIILLYEQSMYNKYSVYFIKCKPESPNPCIGNITLYLSWYSVTTRALVAVNYKG